MNQIISADSFLEMYLSGEHGRHSIDYITSLPDDLLLGIFKKLDFNDMFEIGLVCWKFLRNSVADDLWYHFYHRRYDLVLKFFFFMFIYCDRDRIGKYRKVDSIPWYEVFRDKFRSEVKYRYCDFYNRFLDNGLFFWRW